VFTRLSSPALPEAIQRDGKEWHWRSSPTTTGIPSAASGFGRTTPGYSSG